MAQLFEPLPLEMERFSVQRRDRDVLELSLVDYSKLPRSSGDGMEFSSSNSSDGTSSEGSNDNEISQRKNSSLAAVSVQGQTLGNQIVGTSAEVRITTQLKSYDCKQGNTNAQNIENQQKRTPYGYPLTPVILRTENAQSVSDEPAKAVTIQRQNSTNLLLQGPELPRINSQLGLSLNNDDQFVSLALPATDLNFGERPMKSTVVEHTAEFVNSQKVINDLEEQNSKLVEEKTKLSVQLGVQTKVNAEIKRLLVASVGEDIGNRLEDLVNRNVQQTVELKHWKKMCEEYSEESDRLEIECDVWRTKFLASRMMSDELSSWKVALYARFRQAQSALQRLLDERAQLQQFLVHTKKLIQSLHSMLKSTSGILQGSIPALPTANEHSVIEMASINNSLAEETLGLAQNVLPSLSLSETSLMLTHESLDNAEKLKMELTSAEKLALEVLSSDVDLQAEQQQLRGMMKRMSQQYIGHDYQSRFSTKNFRVTYDCCERCTGSLQVI